MKIKFCLENSDFVKFYKLKDKLFYGWQEYWDRRIWFEVLGASSNRFSLSFDSWILLWQDRMDFIPCVSAELQMSSIFHNILILDSPGYLFWSWVSLCFRYINFSSHFSQLHQKQQLVGKPLSILWDLFLSYIFQEHNPQGKEMWQS